MKITTLFNFLQDTDLVYEKEKLDKDIDLCIQGQATVESQVDFIGPGINDWAAENSNYLGLIDSLGLTSSTNEQLFDMFKDANLAFELKKKQVIISAKDQNMLFNLEHDRLTKLINWYIPSHIDKTQLIFDDISLHKPYEQIAREIWIPVGIIKRLSKDFRKLWKIADVRRKFVHSSHKLKDYHLESIGEFIKDNCHKHWTVGMLKNSIESRFNHLH